jgi:lysozyme
MVFGQADSLVSNMPTCNVVVDLSHHNEKVDLAKAKANGIGGVIHKCSQGSGFVDLGFAGRRKAAAAAGLLWGAYHFGTSADPVSQARFFLKTADPGPQVLVVLDFEMNEAQPRNTMTISQARAFVRTVEEARGVSVGLYGGAFLHKALGSTIDPALSGCWLWWAQYGPEAHIPSNWSRWTLWQYTDGHHGHAPLSVHGIGSCDRDQFSGTARDLFDRWSTGTLAAASSG